MLSINLPDTLVSILPDLLADGSTLDSATAEAIRNAAADKLKNSPREAIWPAQCFAARSWLGWTRDTVAKRANVSVACIARLESGAPADLDDNLAIKRALQAAGITFIYAGVRGPTR